MADVKRLQIRRDTAANWASVNPMLLEGEIGLILGGKSLKIGDGVNSWSQLPTLSLLEDADRKKLSEIILFYEGTDTDDTINKWKELEAFLAGQTETSTLAELLSVKADRTELEQAVSDMEQMDARLSGLIGTKQNAISDLATIRSNATNGNTAYGWGDHSKAGYAMASSLTATQEEVRGYSAIISELQGTVKLKADKSSVDSLAEAIEAINEGIADLTTDDVYEGADKYFTNARAVAALSDTLKGYVTTLAFQDYAVQIQQNSTNITNLTKTVDKIYEEYVTWDNIPTKTSQLTNDSGFITSVTDALGYTPYNSANFTKANIKSTLGISDWALSSSKPTYTAAEVGALPLSGGTLKSAGWGQQLNIWRETTGTDVLIGFRDNGGWLGYLGFREKNKPYFMEPEGTIHTLIHSGNIGDYTLAKDSNGTVLLNGTLYVDGASASIELKEGAIKSNLSGTDSWSIDDSGNGVFNSLKVGGSNVALASDLSGYLPKAGGSINGNLTVYGDPSFSGTLNTRSHYLFVRNNDGADWVVTDKNWQHEYYLIHTGNIGSQSVANASKLGGIDAGRYFYAKEGLITSSNVNTTLNNGVYYTSGYTPVSGAYEYGTFINFRSGAVGVNSRQAQFYISDGAIDTGGIIYYRDYWNSESSITTRWYQLARITDNVASATKLKTARTIWGQSFDGSGNVNGAIALLDNNSTLRNVVEYRAGNLHFGYDTASASVAQDTYINGKTVYLRYRGYATGLILNSSGNVTIGSSDLAGTNIKLRVNGNAAFGTGSEGGCDVFFTRNSTNYLHAGTSTSDSSAGFAFTVGGKGSNNIAFRLESDTTAIFSGNVGIGTTNPAYKLDVAGGVRIDGDINFGEGTGNRQFVILKDGGFTFYGASGGWAFGMAAYGYDKSTNLGNSAGSFGTTNQLHYHFYGGTYDKPHMVILPNANVGIGTTDPQAKLHVVGGAKITQGLTVGSSTDYIAYDGSSLTGYKSSASAWSIDPSGNGSFASLTVGGNAVLTQGALTSINSTLNNKANTSDVIPWSATHNYATTVNPNVPTSPVSDRWYLVVKAAGNGNQLMVNVPWVNTTYDLSSYLPKAGGTISGSLTFSATSGNHIIGNSTQGISFKTSSGSNTTLYFEQQSANSYSIRSDDEAAYWNLGDDLNRFNVLYCRSVSQSSDATLKNILGNVELTTSQIANAPAVNFTWKNGGAKDVGTIAQYWKNVLPEVVSGEEGSYGMNYAVLGVVSAIILARNIETHEQRIARLEKEISDLQKELNTLVNNE